MMNDHIHGDEHYRDATSAEMAADARAAADLDWLLSDALTAAVADIDTSPWLTVEHSHDGIQIWGTDGRGNDWVVADLVRGTDSIEDAVATLCKVANREPLGAAA